MKQVINLFCATALLGATILTPVSGWAEEGGTWQQGGLATNQTSSNMQNVQKYMAQAMATFSLINAVSSMFMIPYWNPLNFDPLGIYLNYKLYDDAKHRHYQLSDEIPELQAAIRQMGSAADLMACEGEEGETCDEVNATLDRTSVHVNTLKNVGLEALEDVSGDLLDTTAELIAAAPYIQAGFGAESEAFDATTNLPNVNLSAEDKKKLEEEMKKAQTTRTETELSNIQVRKKAHLQKMGTAGVARADLGATVAASEKAIDKDLSSFVGSGDGLIANIKVVCGLDLTLSQRLNLVNMLQGQQVANDAAMNLQFVEE